MGYYVPKLYGLFEEQLRLLPHHIQHEIITAIKTHLTETPLLNKKPVYSKTLHGPLDCIRRIHVGPDYVIIYTVCDECKRSFDRKSLIGCQEKLGCYRCYQEPAYRVKVIACGERTGFYSELKANWRTWLNTTLQALDS